MMKLLDTSVIVDIDRGGVQRRVTQLDKEDKHAISVVTITELRLGVNKRYEVGSSTYDQAIEDLDRLLGRFKVLPIERSIGTEAANIISNLQTDGSMLNDLHDIYIAATARSEHLPVLTANVDHFERIDNITVIDWTEY
ncbi:MAG: type II toxin-antitoxin system VapC family toxin [Halobacteriaceae archaeon]